MRKEEKAHMGQKIRSETGPDRSTIKGGEECLMGRKMGGGPTDTSRSEKVGAYNDEKGQR